MTTWWKAEVVGRKVEDVERSGILRAFRVGLIAVSLAIAAALLMAGNPWHLSWWAFGLPALSWMIGPGAAAYFIAAKRPSKARLKAMVFYFIAFALIAALAYYEGLISPQGSTGTLIIIFLPLFQWGILLFVLLILGMYEADFEADDLRGG